MTFAHAGHWLPQLAYLVPLLVLVGAILVGKLRERRERRAGRTGMPDRQERP